MKEGAQKTVYKEEMRLEERLEEKKRVKQEREKRDVRKGQQGAQTYLGENESMINKKE